MMRLGNPISFILIFLIPLTFIFLRKRKNAGILFSDTRSVRQNRNTFRISIFRSLSYIHWGIVVLIIIALARPQSTQSIEKIVSEGIDILLVLDISASMSAEDFEPENRLQAAKSVIRSFLKDRQNDRIGLVVFSGKSIVLCPLTTDYLMLAKLIREVEVGIIEDGTAIGLALAHATNRLRHSTSKSRIVILLTDGENNAGEIDPITAANAAKAIGVKVYTIGVGKEEGALIPYHDPIFGKRYRPIRAYIDEESLKQIARITDGHYFCAINEHKLADIYQEINQLETTRIETTEFIRYKELASYFMLPAIILLVLKIVLVSILRKIP